MKKKKKRRKKKRKEKEKLNLSPQKKNSEIGRNPAQDLTPRSADEFPRFGQDPYYCMNFLIIA